MDRCWRYGRDDADMALEALEVEFSVILGKTQVPMHRLLRMGRGALIPLDPVENDIVEILANGIPVALGRVVVDQGAIGVEVTELIRRPDVVRVVGTPIGRLPAETLAAGSV